MTIKKAPVVILFLINTVFCFEEFLYPVGTLIHEDQHKFCVVHQKGCHLELWFWNPTDQAAIKGLLSTFTPAGIKVVPNQKGFSFIDNDRLRIKMVDKRSPKSVDLFGPYDLTTVNWIDQHSFYFSAKERQHSNLFYATDAGDLVRLTVSNSVDYLYPQKIQNKLFFIEKQEEQYAIKTIEYPETEIEQYLEKLRVDDILDTQHASYKAILPIEQAQTITHFEHKTIAFLQMHSEKLGFFIEHPELVNKQDETMLFGYYMLFHEAGSWSTKKLFDFSIPLYFLLPMRGKIRLYESILPLLPWYDHATEQVYFVDYDIKMDGLNVFVYTITDSLITQKTNLEFYGQSYFVPRLIDGRLFCGGTVVYDYKMRHGPHIAIDPAGVQYFEFEELAI